MTATTASASVNTDSTTASDATTAAPEEAPNQLESAGSMLVHNSHSTGLALALLAALTVAPSLV